MNGVLVPQASTVKAEIFCGVLFSVTSVPTIFTDNKTHRNFHYNRYCIHELFFFSHFLSLLQSIHKKMGSGSGELPYLAIFRDFIVHSAVLRNLKFEKGSKKGT